MAVGYWDPPVSEQEQAHAWVELKTSAHLSWEGNAADAGGMSKKLEINQCREEDEGAHLADGVLCVSLCSQATSLPGQRARASCCPPTAHLWAWTTVAMSQLSAKIKCAKGHWLQLRLIV